MNEIAGEIPADENGRSVFGMVLPRLQAVDGFMKAQLGSFEPEVRSLVQYCCESGGKRIRAVLVFLSGWLDNRDDKAYADAVKVAAIIEMVHLATLVHDDIMDSAAMRRNRVAAGIKFGVDRSVLVGDALFAHALNLASEFPSVEVCRRVSAAVRRVCSGEIMQTLRRGDKWPDMRRYYRIIDLKTAELFKVSCELGAWTAGRPEEAVAAAGQFGRHLGVAYQLYDDLLDYFGDETLAGKSLGGDFRGANVTLPLLALHERLGMDERGALADALGSDNPQVLEHWIDRMEALDVFDEVLSAVRRELADADGALRPFQELSWSGMLRQAATILTEKTTALAVCRMRRRTRPSVGDKHDTAVH